MKVFKAPETYVLEGPSIFLAGSIDMGSAIDWQTKVTDELASHSGTILNPRRDDWDSSWVEDISNPQFNQQVTWELNAMEAVDYIPMFFDPKGKAPISLLELGLFAKTGKMIVCCPEGFWKRGNVQVVCERNRIPLVDNIEELIGMIKARILF